MDDGEVLAAALRHGVNFSRMSTQYRHSKPEHGMFLSYAAVNTEQARDGVEKLRLAFEDLERRSQNPGPRPPRRKAPAASLGASR